jgi:tetratricopeptide (TPR) repeat protein
LSKITENTKEQLEKAPSPRLYLEIFEKLKKENSKEAINVLNEGIKKFPRYVPLLISLGKQYFEMKDWDNAIKIFNEVLKIDKENTIAIKFLANSYEEKKEYVEAIKKYKFLRVFFPQDEELQKKIEELDVLANPPLSSKEKKILKYKKILSKLRNL